MKQHRSKAKVIKYNSDLGLSVYKQRTGTIEKNAKWPNYVY